MPSKAPDTPVIKNIAVNGTALVLQTNKNDPDALKWYVRAKGLKNIGQVDKALKLDYKPHISQEKQVIALAEPIVEEWKRRNARDQPARAATMAKLWADYFKEAKSLTLANEALVERGQERKWPVEQGRGYWTKALLVERETHWNAYLKPFFQDKERYRGKPATDITYQDIKAWRLWRDELAPDLAPSTLNKQNSTLRHLFKLAVRQGENFAPPVIEDEKPNLQKRTRSRITDEQMLDVEKYLEGRYRGAFEQGKVDKHTYYPFLLRHYLDLLKFTGIRPWNGKKNAVKMEHIVPLPDKGNAAFLIKRIDEKAHEPYSAIASRRFVKTYDSVNRFYEYFGLGKDREYFFCHPVTLSKIIQKGAPIQSFKKQWQTMTEHFKTTSWKDGASFEDLTFYSYRHSFITNKLVNNKDISIWDLSKSTGTSIRMIEQIYGHYLAEERFEDLNAVDYDYVDTCSIFSESGLEIGEVSTNGKAHWQHWKETPHLVAFPPLGDEK